jgi:outer membrane protein assembly factor BamB
MKRISILKWLATSFLLCSSGLISLDGFSQSNWPAWRGDGSGVSPDKNLPVSWDTVANVGWKVKTIGEGNSSPVIVDGKLIITSSSDSGRIRNILCYQVADGMLAWEKSFSVNAVAPTYPKNGYASATVCSDGDRIFAFFDSPGLVALDFNGNTLWTASLGNFKNEWNLASSPAVNNGKVYVVCDHEAGSFIAAYEASTGKEIWRTPRIITRSYSSPRAIEYNGKIQIVINGPVIFSYDAETGQELWRCDGMGETIVPSVLYEGGWVYASSGRNGPSVAIDPSGRGNITETHVKMHLTSGGPYVPSPVFYPYLFLPGDNGAWQFVDSTGKIILKGRIPAHFTSSPVGGDTKIYWAAENGNVYVIDVSKVKTATPVAPVLSTNGMGEEILSTPAIYNGQLFIRTAGSLYCINKGKTFQKVSETANLPLNFDTLKQLFYSKKACEGPEIAQRLDILETMSKLNSPEFPGFLKNVCIKDCHWDVCEEAAKILGDQGVSAVPEIIQALNEAPEYMPFIKIILINSLESYKAKEAIPSLIKYTSFNYPLIRVAAVKALGKTCIVNPDSSIKILPVIKNGLNDANGKVRKEAIETVVLLKSMLGNKQEIFINDIRKLCNDQNLEVSRLAEKMLKEIFHVELPATIKAEQLNAGPISVLFKDGELRYIFAGNKEVARRIYFAVRDKNWGTVMPVFESYQIEKTANSFKIYLKARCLSEISDYSWNAVIEGKADGELRFSAKGIPNSDFESARIGICVLYGSGSLSGQKFTTLSESGKSTDATFPAVVKSTLVDENFITLNYKTADGLEVSTDLKGNGQFNMEDQRTYGDASYKAYAPMYSTTKLTKGQNAEQAFTLRVKNVKPTQQSQTLSVKISEKQIGAHFPKLVNSEKAYIWFATINDNPEKFKNEATITISYNPVIHMPDEDTRMENQPALLEAVDAVRFFAPGAAIRIDPIVFESSNFPPAKQQEANNFNDAWSLRMMKYLTLSNVKEAAFNVPVNNMDLLKSFEGKKLIDVEVSGYGFIPVDAFGVESDGKTKLWLINITNQLQTVKIRNGSLFSLNGYETREISIN